MRQAGWVRALPDSGAPPDAGGDAAKPAWLDKFKSMMECRPPFGTDAMHCMAVREKSVLGRLLKGMRKAPPCAPPGLRKRPGTKYNTYGNTLKRGERCGLLNRDGDKVVLTREGRLHALALRLRIPMAGMCVMSDMYVTWAWLWGEELRVYCKKREVQERLGVADSYMLKIYGRLVGKGHMRCKKVKPGERHKPGFYYMNGGLFAHLHESMGDLIWMQNSRWTFGKHAAGRQDTH